MPASRIVLALSVLLAAGCASHPSSIRVGEPAAEVVARLGTPAETVRRTVGERLVYPTGPMGQAAYLVDIGPDGRVSAVTQALTDERFAQIRKGEWDQARVRQEFGPPAESVVLTLKQQLVWSYRYKQQGVWNSLMHVHFDHDGIVQDYYPGPDPMFERDGKFFGTFGPLR
jgi:hypothetical protein